MFVMNLGNKLFLNFQLQVYKLECNYALKLTFNQKANSGEAFIHIKLA